MQSEILKVNFTVFQHSDLRIEKPGRNIKCVTSILGSIRNVQVCRTHPNNDNKYTEYTKIEAIVYLRLSEGV